MIIQAIALLDQLDKDLNTFAMRGALVAVVAAAGASCGGCDARARERCHGGIHWQRNCTNGAWPLAD